ncbi:hypothetical protein Nepgr_010146 [Nepenthes gracilis]|uniref:Uncharacterized protein n=1 Tax=Nepenthes gracilis TaxID=150966 RepID=A0AAD3SCF1_NEPGR|nr:hypothetical protein Nepgr_010146 [Nepenthes gracilis]
MRLGIQKEYNERSSVASTDLRGREEEEGNGGQRREEQAFEIERNFVPPSPQTLAAVKPYPSLQVFLYEVRGLDCHLK